MSTRRGRYTPDTTFLEREREYPYAYESTMIPPPGDRTGEHDWDEWRKKQKECAKQARYSFVVKLTVYKKVGWLGGFE